jgi:plastocyanin
MKQDSDRYNPFRKNNMITLRTATAGVAVIMLVGTVVGLLVSQNAARTARQTIIQVTDKGFIPATISVKAGSTVVWRNVDTAPHVVASNPYPADSSVGGLHSQTIPPSGSYTYVAGAKGAIGYHDDTQPTMSGMIVVGQ